MIPPAVLPVLARYRDLLEEVDAWFTACSLAAGDQIACCRGCSACCRGLFDITLLDAALVQQGVRRLPVNQQELVRTAAVRRLADLQQIWPDFAAPWILNSYPEEQWDQIMPDDDETPCPYLSAAGSCLIYAFRPMTCRLHGLPMIDTSGEVLFDEWCSLNFIQQDPLHMTELRASFNDIFRQEQLLFRECIRCLAGTPVNELDTLLPAAALIDFQHLLLPERLWTPDTT